MERWAVPAIVLVVVAAIALAVWTTGDEQRAVQSLAPGDRAELYAEVRRYVDAVCARSAIEPGLRGRCTDGAEFLLAFPECDGPCQEAARARLRVPAR